MAIAKLTAMRGPFPAVKFICTFKGLGRFLRPLLLSLALTAVATLTATTATAQSCHSVHAHTLTSKQITSRIDALIETEIRLGSHDYPKLTLFEQALAHYESERQKLSQLLPDFDHLYSERYLTLAREIKRKQKKERKQARQEEETRRRVSEEQIINVINGKRAIFHKVQPGSFTRGEGPDQVLVTLTEMPEVMATQLTQIIYKTVAELANNRFPEKYQINADPSHYKGDTRPVERVSWDEAQTWADALNDLSKAEEPALQALIPGHQKGMHYEPFMSDAQREYLMKIAKTEDGDSIDEMVQRNDEAKLKRYFAFGRTDNEGTVDVAELKPLFIDGKPFYGLTGNAREWTRDSRDMFDPPPAGTDPIGTTGIYRVLHGSCWINDVAFLRSAQRGHDDPGYHSSTVSIRLARRTAVVSTQPQHP